MAFEAGLGYTVFLQGWSQTIKLSLQHEHYKLINQSYKNSNLFIPSISWLHNKSDDPVRPTTGHKFKINIQGGSKYLLASNNFFQAEIDIKYLKTFSSKIQILFHTNLGFTDINEINNLPLSLQFYAGGTQSIRGFGYSSIGPGCNLLTGSMEVRFPLISNWYLTTFYDVGNASNDLFAKLNRSVGGGIVYRSSIGIFELNYAKALSQSGTPGRIQFSLGPDL